VDTIHVHQVLFQFHRPGSSKATSTSFNSLLFNLEGHLRNVAGSFEVAKKLCDTHILWGEVKARVCRERSGSIMDAKTGKTCCGYTCVTCVERLVASFICVCTRPDTWTFREGLRAYWTILVVPWGTSKWVFVIEITES